MLNTYPASPWPLSMEQLHKGNNEQIQAEINEIKNELNGEATEYPFADSISIENAIPANIAGCIVKIEPVQSGNGDPSPTNIRPITGHTQSVVTVANDAENPTITETYTISLGGTVYGGSVDFSTGVMTVTHGIVDLGSKSWYAASDKGRVSCTGTISNAVMPSENYEKANMLCDTYSVLPYYVNGQSGVDAVGTDCSFAIMSRTTPYVHDARLANMTGEQVKEALNGVNVLYELATPTTIQLTPQQIQLLKGQNTLTASTGQISVTVNGVAGAIGQIQTQVNELAEDVAEINPVNYSTTEQATGQKWIDGKDIYFVVITLNSDITINANSWSTAIDLTGDKLIAASALYSVENNVYPIGGNLSENKLLILNIRGSAILVDTIIAYYTK